MRITEQHIHNSKTFAELVDYVMKWDKIICKHRNENKEISISRGKS